MGKRHLRRVQNVSVLLLEEVPRVAAGYDHNSIWQPLQFSHCFYDIDNIVLVGELATWVVRENVFIWLLHTFDLRCSEVGHF